MASLVGYLLWKLPLFAFQSISINYEIKVVKATKCSVTLDDETYSYRSFFPYKEADAKSGLMHGE